MNVLDKGLVDGGTGRPHAVERLQPAVRVQARVTGLDLLLLKDLEPGRFGLRGPS